ncbi:radical SAM family heme chaperone HemW [Neoactinobaculum massilliense]|uniref:radical SAM family heme chaperone HemW n=1 Tax=Neoactinobaculum massilliense TaxID=2364794 RepID=UPI000F522E31|nr:radical SAM family heme chaperone HemW [Neoactinobaculum massilliense]
MAKLPDGIPVPPDGRVPNPDVSAGFSAYVHIPFCRVRCGYCDFNTYTNLNFGEGASTGDYPESLAREIALSRRVLDTGDNHAAVRTIFFGGGTPTMLRPEQLVGVVADLREAFGVVRGAEITTECNPETVGKAELAALREGGFTRISFGMQSAVPAVLRTLDRLHTPGQVEKVTTWARELGLEYSVDLIYGAPGETMEQWEASVREAISFAPNHISAYGLQVEPGTKMGAQARRGEIQLPDPDIQADKYELADTLFTEAGYRWYEISNWAKPGHECRHNLLYWHNANWWGYGPGAHSHINGERFWNVKHPLAYAQRLALGTTPAQAREVLSPAEQREEDIMLGIRLREGIPVPSGVREETLAELRGDGLIDAEALRTGRVRLTRHGRLLGDVVTRALW